MPTGYHHFLRRQLHMRNLTLACKWLTMSIPMFDGVEKMDQSGRVTLFGVALHVRTAALNKVAMTIRSRRIGYEALLLSSRE